MAAWPGNPIAYMAVVNGAGTNSADIELASTPTQQTVYDTNIDFVINILYSDHPYLFHGKGKFSATLERFTTSGWQPVASVEKVLGDDNNSGDWSDTLTLSVAMADLQEQYHVHLHCETVDMAFGSSMDVDAFYIAVQGDWALGDFTLDFVPLSIVYCPPGQDMTASLSQTRQFGTRFTLGEGTGMQSQNGVQAQVGILGLIGEGFGYSSSQGGSNQNTSGIQISHFRNTVITADNQKAIGRAYWGPLGDLFVILVNPNFAASKRADGTIFYCLQNIEQVLLVPAWKLLRPNGDPIASLIPADARRRLLELDPFITNLDQFLPTDSGAPLSVAANPYADPSGNSRAELIGRWWLDTGTEISYAINDTRQLSFAQGQEVRFSSSVTINAQVSGNYNGISAALGVDTNNMTWVGVQTSQETDVGYSQTAGCFLIHNQNERDLDGIELYYDRNFSTFMFRRISSRIVIDKTVGAGAVVGRIVDIEHAPLFAINVTLTDSAGSRYVTSTRRDGSYAFFNIPVGTYSIEAGDHQSTVRVAAESTPVAPVRKDLNGVRRVIDLAQSPGWEILHALQLPSTALPELTSGRIKDLTQLARHLKLPKSVEHNWGKKVALARSPTKPRVPKHHRKKKR